MAALTTVSLISGKLAKRMPPCDVRSLKRVEPLIALTYDLGEQDDEGRTIHRHFVVGIDHAGMAAAWPEYLVDDMGSTIEYHVLLGKSRRAAERALEPHDLAHAIKAAKRLSDPGPRPVSFATTN